MNKLLIAPALFLVVVVGGLVFGLLGNDTVARWSVIVGLAFLVGHVFGHMAGYEDRRRDERAKLP